jgi:preprotein translocase subunit Sec61beta
MKTRTIDPRLFVVLCAVAAVLLLAFAYGVAK